MVDQILAATRWATNGQLIADVSRLGYLPAGAVVLDPTYGRGRWWTDYRPDHLIAHDLRLDGVDFRRLPESAASVDVVAFDPPYIAQGGRSTSTLASTGNDFLDRYGLHDVPSTVDAITDMIGSAAAEFHRVLRPRGLLLVKCMNYVNGGRYRQAAYDILATVDHHGFDLIDELVHLRRPGPQPRRDRQMHARRNYSLLFVFRRDRRPHHPTLFECEAS
jgi:DNA modification methylase